LILLCKKRKPQHQPSTANVCTQKMTCTAASSVDHSHSIQHRHTMLCFITFGIRIRPVKPTYSHHGIHDVRPIVAGDDDEDRDEGVQHVVKMGI